MKANTLRKIGKYGPEVTPVGIGAMSFTNFYANKIGRVPEFVGLKNYLDKFINKKKVNFLQMINFINQSV